MSFDPVMPPFGASDPNAHFLSASCLDFLLIELVPMAYRVTNQLEEEATAAAAASATAVSGVGADESAQAQAQTQTQAQGQAQIARTVGSGSRKMDEEEEKDAVFFRLEGLGYRVGQGLVERFVAFLSFSREYTSPGRFICWFGMEVG